MSPSIKSLLFFGIKEPEIERWKIEVENYQNLSLDFLEAVLNSAEKYFDETIESYNTITSRAYALLSIFISLIGILIAFFISQIVPNFGTPNKYLISIFFIVLPVSLYCIFVLIRLIFPDYRMNKGDIPSTNDFKAIAQQPIENQLLNYLNQVIADTEYKIRYNEKVIQQRLRLLEKVIKASVGTLVVILILLLLAFSLL